MKEGGPACVMQEACLWRAVDPTACRICMTLHDACTARLERGTTLLVRIRVHTRKILRSPAACIGAAAQSYCLTGSQHIPAILPCALYPAPPSVLALLPPALPIALSHPALHSSPPAPLPPLTQLLDYKHNHPQLIENCAGMLIKVFSNVLEHPLEDKYKQVWNVCVEEKYKQVWTWQVDKQVWAGVCAEGVHEKISLC